VPALTDLEPRHTEQRACLGEQQLVQAFLAERRQRLTVGVGIADHQVAVGQLRDQQVDPGLQELGALGAQTL